MIRYDPNIFRPEFHSEYNWNGDKIIVIVSQINDLSQIVSNCLIAVAAAHDTDKSAKFCQFCHSTLTKISGYLEGLVSIEMYGQQACYPRREA